MKRRPPNRTYDYDRDRYDRPTTPKNSGGLPFNLNYAMIALIAGIFVLGIGVGMVFSTSANFTPENVASREVIDRSAPDAELCQQFGASAIVADLRVFLTLNPFNVYVTQPAMQPGCVLRRNNWAVLQNKNLLSNDQVNECKNRMNTFGFTGSLDSGVSKISCIYQNDSAGNLFLNKPGTSGGPSETDNF